MPGVHGALPSTQMGAETADDRGTVRASRLTQRGSGDAATGTVVTVRRSHDPGKSLSADMGPIVPRGSPYVDEARAHTRRAMAIALAEAYRSTAGGGGGFWIDPDLPVPEIIRGLAAGLDGATDLENEVIGAIIDAARHEQGGNEILVRAVRDAAASGSPGDREFVRALVTWGKINAVAVAGWVSGLFSDAPWEEASELNGATETAAGSSAPSSVAEDFDEWSRVTATRVSIELPGGLQLADALRGREMSGLDPPDEPERNVGEDADEYEVRLLEWEMECDLAAETRSAVQTGNAKLFSLLEDEWGGALQARLEAADAYEMIKRSQDGVALHGIIRAAVLDVDAGQVGGMVKRDCSSQFADLAADGGAEDPASREDALSSSGACDLQLSVDRRSVGLARLTGTIHSKPDGAAANDSTEPSAETSKVSTGA